MPIPNASPEVVLPAGWIQLPGWQAWTRGSVQNWAKQWDVERDGTQYAVSRNGSGEYLGGDRLLFPTPLAAMMWVELEIANGP
jgi:hypothetical protein